MFLDNDKYAVFVFLLNQFDFTHVSDVVNGIMQTVNLLEESVGDCQNLSTFINSAWDHLQLVSQKGIAGITGLWKVFSIPQS